MAKKITCDRCGERIGGTHWQVDMRRHEIPTYADVCGRYVVNGADLCDECAGIVIRLLSRKDD